jgi:hypothetical protein
MSIILGVSEGLWLVLKSGCFVMGFMPFFDRPYRLLFGAFATED